MGVDCSSTWLDEQSMEEIIAQLMGVICAGFGCHAYSFQYSLIYCFM